MMIERLPTPHHLFFHSTEEIVTFFIKLFFLCVVVTLGSNTMATISTFLTTVLLLASVVSNTAFVPRTTCHSNAFGVTTTRSHAAPLFMSAVADKPVTETTERMVVR
jgi:hypothetical protein